MNIYRYDRTSKIYLEKMEAQESPLEANVFLFPPYTTPSKPQDICKDNQCCIFNEELEVFEVYDYVYKIVDADCNNKITLKVGSYDNEIYTKKIPFDIVEDPYIQVYNNDSWELIIDINKQKHFNIQLIKEIKNRYISKDILYNGRYISTSNLSINRISLILNYAINNNLNEEIYGIFSCKNDTFIEDITYSQIFDINNMILNQINKCLFIERLMIKNLDNTDEDVNKSSLNDAWISIDLDYINKGNTT